MVSGLVSVVIPTYNYGHFVCTAVESALGQTYRPVEVIVVNDGSTDDTRARLAGYGARIRYISQKNQGLSAARNTGIRESNGAFVALLDSDDAFHPRKLEIQISQFASNPSLCLLGTGQFSEEPIAWQDCTPEQSTLVRLSLEDVVMAPRFPPSSALVRRHCFEQVGYFDTELRSVEDRDMWIRIAAQFPIAMIKEPLTWYRTTAGSMSRNPETMEHYERIVLERALRLPELASRRIFRRQVLALSLFSRAYMYGAANRQSIACSRLLRSLISWPWLSRSRVRMDFARPRLLAVTMLRMLRLKRPEFSS